ncbi:hypothetical protein DL93DRAFT_2081348 [Clavulina sp. PMI_390]|nr:hypothetical protein DL93DRAFT_2081348 [Clavulina sp. PMI_390]
MAHHRNIVSEFSSPDRHMYSSNLIVEGHRFVVYSPQIYENYSRRSGEGVSVGLILAWLLADLSSAVGAIMAGMVPTVIIIASYYALCDLAVLIQIYYYRIFYAARERLEIACSLSSSEEEPLLDPSSHPSASLYLENEISLEKSTPMTTRQLVVQYILLWAFVFSFGIAAFLFNHQRNHQSLPKPPDGDNGPTFEWKSQVMGWLSACLYIGSRFPQIKKNMKTRCEGLYLGLFMFMSAGNFFYGLSLAVLPMDFNQRLTAASWFVGTFTCIILDLFVIAQWLNFRRQDVLRLEAQLRAPP